jgi:aspartyl-tRNA(Asn)/glutamyl-tRNA(Gln) amidotransferase subunit A
MITAKKSVVKETSLKEINKEYNYFNHIIDKPSKDRFLVSVKDCICTKNIPTTAGSQILNNYLPRFDATVIEKIKKAGGSIIGKTSMDAFGFGSFSVNVGLDKKIPLNPFDKKRTCGGSSGGAAGLTQLLDKNHIALAESTGGSIACPAAFCGVVGLTPTYGRVSRYGQIDYGNSLDKIGPMAKTVKRCAEVLEIISGTDKKDATCIKKPKDFLTLIDKPINKLKLGIIKEAFGNGVDKEVAQQVKEAIKKLEAQGVTIEQISLPLTMKYGISVYYLLSMTEASTNLAKLCGLRYGQEHQVEGKSFNDYFTQVRSKHFNKETKRRILIGTFARMAGFRDAYYIKAAKIRTLIIEEYKNLFKKYDLLISPSMPIIAPTFTEIKKLTPLQNYMLDILTVGPNLAGLPHLSVPCGFVNKMPVGMLIIGDHWDEKTMLQLGHAYQELQK